MVETVRVEAAREEAVQGLVAREEVTWGRVALEDGAREGAVWVGFAVVEAVAEARPRAVAAEWWAVVVMEVGAMALVALAAVCREGVAAVVAGKAVEVKETAVAVAHAGVVAV